jgi:hypothetical protein
MGMSRASQEIIWLHQPCQELGVPQQTATTLFGDNAGCIAITTNPQHHDHTKHIDIRHRFIQEQVEKEVIEVQYCNTKLMLADALTSST